MSLLASLLGRQPVEGYVRGELGSYIYEARLTRGTVSYGLDPDSLYKGWSRLARLVIYQKLTGDPEGPTRKLASYDRGWHFGRQKHLALVRRVVRQLDRHCGGIA